jgi:predicted RNase H-like nuclease (RuvC/YqgF family)
MSASTITLPTPEAKAAEIVTFPQRPQDRLRIALHKLDEALRAQARATSDFRSAMGDLKSKVGGMQDGMVAYRDALDRTATEIDRAVKKAKELQETARRMAPHG